MRTSVLRLLFGLWIGAAGQVALAKAIDSPNSDDIIAQSSQRLERRPHDRMAILRLGDAYARKGRETGDVSYFGLAERALRLGAEKHPQDSAIRRHLAYVLSLNHDFAQAAQEARRALELDPSNTEAHGVLGDALLEQGQYDVAEAAYLAMVQGQASLASLSRLSGLRVLQGRAGEARTLLRRAIELGRRSGEPAESVAWAQWQLGMEYFNAGRLRSAQGWFRQALRTFPGYYRAHGGLGLVHVARGHYVSAAKAISLAMATVPLPEYAIALGDVHTLMRTPGQAEEFYALAHQIARLNKGSNSREHTLFILDRGESPESALQWAESDLLQRQDIYAYDVYAWALYKNGRAPEAQVAMARALSTGAQDARMFFRAGLIQLALGDRIAGRRFLQRALAVNPHFHPRHADLAKRIVSRLHA